MKILLVHEKLTYGGADKQIVWLANLLSNYAETHFLTFRSNSMEQRLDDRIKLFNIKTENSGHNVKTLLLTSKKIRRLIKKEKYTYCIAYSSPSQLRLLLATIGLSTQTVVSQRGDPYHSQSHGLLKKVFSFLFSLADVYVFQTTFARDYYSKRIKKKSFVIPNAIKPWQRTTTRSENVEKRIVNLARYDIAQKRQDLLIDAFKTVYKKHPDYCLELYGDGPDKEKLETMIEDCPNIKICGKTLNPAIAMENAEMFILNSDYEGIPNSLLEAMSLGVPCICTDYSPGGISTIIHNHANGIIIPPNNVKELISAIEFYIDNPTLREEYGKKAIKVSEEYSNDRISSMWLDIFNINR